MNRPSLPQSLAHYALENARWGLLGCLVLGWLWALGARLDFLRAAGASQEPALLLRAWADRKELPITIEGHGAYFRLVPSPEGARLEPLFPEVLVDGARVNGSGLELGKAPRAIAVDGLLLQYSYQDRTAWLAQTGWSLRQNCVTLGKSLSAEVSLDLPGVPLFAARICRQPPGVENLSARVALSFDGAAVEAGKSAAWSLEKPAALSVGDASLSLRVVDGRTEIMLAPDSRRLVAIRQGTLVGNLQMQFTKIVPEAKSDYQLLERLQEALDRDMLDLDEDDSKPTQATTAEEEEVRTALSDDRVRTLLEQSRRELAAGRPENAQVLTRQGAIYDVRARALSVIAPGRAARKSSVSLKAEESSASPWLEVEAGPEKGLRILTDAPSANGLCDLALLGKTEPESLYGPMEMRRASPSLAAGRLILLADSGAAVVQAQAATDPSKRSRIWTTIEAGETLGGLVQRLALTPDSRNLLQGRILQANPGLDPRRIRPGQRLALDRWPELDPGLFERAIPRLHIERVQAESYARVVHGPASLNETKLEDGAYFPLRSGDRLKFGPLSMEFEDPRGVLRSRKLSDGRIVERYPMGDEAVLISGFEDRLSPLVEAHEGQTLSLDANLQQTASRVLREHLDYFDSIQRRRYGVKGKVHAASMTVINWKTGAILAAASLPAFDPEAPDGYQKAALELGASSPFLDRNFASFRPAGSTFKLVVLAAYLEKLEKEGHLPAPGEPVGPAFSCGDGQSAGSGAIILNGKALRCHRASKGGHGLVHDADEAFKVSCNVYFSKLALELSGFSWDEAQAPSSPQPLALRGQLAPVSPIFDMASRLGFDYDYRGWGPADRSALAGLRTASKLGDWFEPLGVSDRASVLAGTLPAPLHFLPGGPGKLPFDGITARLEHKPLRHLVYLAIGQDMGVSTYHLALMAAAVANDGALARPWLSEADTKGAPPTTRIFSAAVARKLREAMAGVTSRGGTAGMVLGSVEDGGSFPFRIYGKTGTAQVASSERQNSEARRADSLFLSFIDDPRLPPLAVAVRVENGDSSAEADGVLLQTTGKHLAGRFYSALMDEYGVWPEEAAAKHP